MSRALGLIAALDRRRVIGHDGTIPWRHPADGRHFRRTTLHHAVIMGRKTHASIGKPLDKRHNIVVSSQLEQAPPGCLLAPSLTAALAAAYALDAAPLVIGGARLYREALPLCTTLHLTWVPGEHPGDTFFPEYDPDAFEEQARREEAGLVFVTLQRRVAAPNHSPDP